MIILSDIDGVYDKDPKTESDAKLIDLVENADRLIETISIGGTSSFGTGGIASKIEAASRVNKFGIPMLLLNGEKENINSKQSGRQEPRNAVSWNHRKVR